MKVMWHVTSVHDIGVSPVKNTPVKPDENGNARTKFLSFLAPPHRESDRKMATVTEGTPNALARSQSPPPEIDLETGEPLEPLKDGLVFAKKRYFQKSCTTPPLER